MELNGKKIFVAGASSGIGQATAIMISKLGGKVVLNGRNEERLNETRSMMEGDGHLVMPYDLLQFEGVNRYIRKCVEIDGISFDGLVFSAGVSLGSVIRMTKLDSFRNIMEQNFLPYAALLKEFSSKKVLKNGGSIVALSSSATVHFDKAHSAYACSKNAIEAISNVASHELVRRKIRVNSVCPEMTRTPMTQDYFGTVSQEKRDAHYPLGALEPEDVANTIVFLLSNMSSKITGQKIYLSAGNDGGPINYILD